ncbi:MAG: HAMP domain-containing histidine kinase [Oscillospiraceae bacterium]|nr:HAMP domain-containing histidine kinase [Oscillospiraceae bacterium]
MIGEKTKKILIAINRYAVYFALIAFLITCCTMLFVTTLSEVTGLVMTEENISASAKLTFANVVLLSAIFTAIDGYRRHVMIDVPAKRITDAAKKFMQGDFSVRIQPIHSLSDEDHFNEIISCFNQMAEELSGTETLRTDFIANVSHELKTPLAVMQNYASMLQNPDITAEEQIEYAKNISGASHRLANLISNILKLNKLENQQIFPKAEPYDLGEQLCECLLVFEDAWDKKSLDIETDIEESVTVDSDREMMSLVWNNLFSNAVKFTPEHGKISLRLYTDGSDAVVEIADTGCGISNEVGRRMFDKFYQGDTSHATQGNGLGLALVKRVIDITHSSISVESEVGKGTTFTVRMPRYKIIVKESGQ